MSRNTNKILSMLLAVLMLASVMSVFGVSAADFGKVTMIDEVTATVTEPIAGQEPDYDVANEVQNATITQVTWWRVENDMTATAMKTGEKLVSCPIMNAEGQVLGLIQKNASDDSTDCFRGILWIYCFCVSENNSVF